MRICECQIPKYVSLTMKEATDDRLCHPICVRKSMKSVSLKRPVFKSVLPFEAFERFFVIARKVWMIGLSHILVGQPGEKQQNLN